ncbi:hypothetical protein MBLNU459_g4739t1 [Dothideomycetes sp. NU459]
MAVAPSANPLDVSILCDNIVDSSTIPKRSSRPGPFLSLPPEIRNQIYMLLLSPPYITLLRKISTRSLCSDYVLPSTGLCPALLGTCKQIHAEALTILYGSNTFAAHVSLLTSMPHLISPRRPVISGPGRAKIRKWYIHVRLDVDPGFDAAQAEAAFTGAETLEIDVYQSSYGICDTTVLTLFEGVRGVGHATVSGSTGCRPYCSWLEQTMMKPVAEEIQPFCEEGEEYEVWKTGNR